MDRVSSLSANSAGHDRTGPTPCCHRESIRFDATHPIPARFGDGGTILLPGGGLMRTIDRLSPTAALPWLREQGDRLRRTLLARRLAVRWGLVLAAVLGLAAAGYCTTLSLLPGGSRFLASGRSFSKDDLIKVCRALDAKSIEYHCDAQRRVAVAADQFEQGAAALAKLDLGPHPLDELRTSSDWLSSLVATPDEREQKRLLSRERILEAIINELDGVVSALVSIQYPRARAAWHPRTKPSAFVYLETEANRPLPSRTVQSIPAILMSSEPDLSHETITVMDRRGYRYLDPHNPALGDLSRSRAREEEVREEILERLAWIKGVKVSVDLIDRRDAEPVAAPAVGAPSKPSSSHAIPAPTIVVNQPAELNPEPQPAAPPPAAVATKPATRGGPSEQGR